WSANNNAPPSTRYRVFFGTNSDPSIYSPITETTDKTATLPYELDPDTIYYWQVQAELSPFPAILSPVWQFRTASVGFTLDPVASPRFVGEPFPISVQARD